jgi:hypothetical protein
LIDEIVARLCAHRKNVARYRLLLETSITSSERVSIEQLLVQETAAIESLVSSPLNCVQVGTPVQECTAGTHDGRAIAPGLQ